MRLIQANLARRGLTLVEMVCVIAIIGILAALLLPGLAKARDRARQTQCAGQLQEIGLAFHGFAHDHNNLFPMRVPVAAGGSMEYARAGSYSNSFAFRHLQALEPNLGTPRVLVCPADTRLPALGFSGMSNHNVSFFVALSADYGRPASVLAGDRNLTNDWVDSSPVQRLGPNYRLRWSHELHRFRGNLLFGDGHVEQQADAGLMALAARAEGGAYVLNLPADPVPARSGGSTVHHTPPGGATHSSARENRSEPSAPASEAREPAPGKETEARPSGIRAPQRPEISVAVSIEGGSHPASASGSPVTPGRSAEPKPETGKPDHAPEVAATSPGDPASAAAAPSVAGEERGFLAEIVDTSLKFLWLYYLAVVMLGLLALLLRKRLGLLQDNTPAQKKF